MISKTRLLELVKDLKWREIALKGSAGVTTSEIMSRKKDPDFRRVSNQLLAAK